MKKRTDVTITLLNQLSNEKITHERNSNALCGK